LLSLILAAILSYVWLSKGKNLFVFIHAVNIISFLYFFSLLSSARHPHYYGSIYLSFFVLCAYLLSIVSKQTYSTLILGFIICVYVVLNAMRYSFIIGTPNNQIAYAERIAKSMVPYIDHKLFNLATYPIEFTSEDTFLYFLEKQGLRVANREARQVTEQMFVLCDREPCRILDSHSWNIEMFGKAKVDTMWEISGVKIYRLIHEK
jgi:hypothetical protein